MLKRIFFFQPGGVLWKRFFLVPLGSTPSSRGYSNAGYPEEWTLYFVCIKARGALQAHYRWSSGHHEPGVWNSGKRNRGQEVMEPLHH